MTFKSKRFLKQWSCLSHTMSSTSRLVFTPPLEEFCCMDLQELAKTMLAKAVAHHTTAAFIHVVGSEFVQKYFGEVKSL
jgi:hypothetical protein